MNSQNLNIVPSAAPNNASLSAVYTDVIGALLQLPRKHNIVDFTTLSNQKNAEIVLEKVEYFVTFQSQFFCHFFQLKDS